MNKVEIQIAYAQYYLVPTQVHGIDAEENGTDDGLIMASDDAIWIRCGTRHGTLALEVSLLEGPPEEMAAGWDAIAERSFSTASGERRITTWDSDWPELPVVPAGGTYRLRAHARGREAAAETDEGEQHSLWIWPAPMSEGLVVKTDGLAQEADTPGPWEPPEDGPRDSPRATTLPPPRSAVGLPPRRA